MFRFHRACVILPLGAKIKQGTLTVFIKYDVLFFACLCVCIIRINYYRLYDNITKTPTLISKTSVFKFIHFVIFVFAVSINMWLHSIIFYRYLFDLGSGSIVSRLLGHSDVVSDVAFNPLHPQLASASYDAKVRFYSELL